MVRHGQRHRGGGNARASPYVVLFLHCRESMALLFVFLLGIANFALHRAVLESGHPILRQIGWLYGSLGGRLSLMVEFMLLVGTMLLITSGTVWWALGYLFYSLLNGLSAWLIVSNRV